MNGQTREKRKGRDQHPRIQDIRQKETIPARRYSKIKGCCACNLPAGCASPVLLVTLKNRITEERDKGTVGSDVCENRGGRQRK